MNELLKDFLNDYYNGSLKEMKDDKYFQDNVCEFANNQVPIYNCTIDEEYKECSITIDDVIEEGLMESMKSEFDIIKAKQVALYMSYEQEIYNAIQEEE